MLLNHQYSQWCSLLLSSVILTKYARVNTAHTGIPLDPRYSSLQLLRGHLMRLLFFSMFRRAIEHTGRTQ